MKVVVDTNVLISGIFWKGNESRLIRHLARGTMRNATTAELLDELDRSLAYPKFGYTRRERMRVVDFVRSFSMTVVPSRHIRAVEGDKDDDRLVECALEAGARCIISGDAHLLKLKRFHGVRIMSTKEMLDLVMVERI